MPHGGGYLGQLFNKGAAFFTRGNVTAAEYRRLQ